jgi:hypothetical protein
MGIATIIFWLGRHRFVRVPPSPGGKQGLFDALVTTLLFTPLFSIIVGYFVLWEHFLSARQEAAKRAGTEFAGVTGRLVGEYFSAYWWLPAMTIAAVLVGVVLFRVRQRIQSSATFLPVLLYNLTHQRQREHGMGFFDVGRQHFGDEAGDGPPAVLKIMLVFSMVSVFWALFDQHASTWIDQAEEMDRLLSIPAYVGYWIAAATLILSLYGGLWLFRWIGNALLPRKLTLGVVGAVLALALVAAIGDAVGPPIGDIAGGPDGPLRQRTMTIEIGAAQVSAVNPLLVMIIIPALQVLVYAPLRSVGIEIKPLQRMTVGMFLSAAAFVAAALLQQSIESAESGSIHVLWQTTQYFVMTVAEVLISITGLEFAYTQAPRAMKSTIMGFWLFCVTMGNLLVAFLAPLQKTLALSQFFWLFAGLMACAAIVFLVLARLYTGKTYLQHTN